MTSYIYCIYEYLAGFVVTNDTTNKNVITNYTADEELDKIMSELFLDGWTKDTKDTKETKENNIQKVNPFLSELKKRNTNLDENSQTVSESVIKKLGINKSFARNLPEMYKPGLIPDSFTISVDTLKGIKLRKIEVKDRKKEFKIETGVLGELNKLFAEKGK